MFTFRDTAVYTRFWALLELSTYKILNFFKHIISSSWQSYFSSNSHFKLRKWKEINVTGDFFWNPEDKNILRIFSNLNTFYVYVMIMYSLFYSRFFLIYLLIKMLWVCELCIYFRFQTYLNIIEWPPLYVAWGTYLL